MNEYGIKEYLSLITQGRYDKIGKTAINAMAKQIGHLERANKNLPIQNVRQCNKLFYYGIGVLVGSFLTGSMISLLHYIA